MIRLRLAVLAAALLLTACASAQPPAPDLRVSGNRLFIAAEINGQPIEALLDSGSVITFLDAAAATRLGLEWVVSDDQRMSGFGTEDIGFIQVAQVRAAGTTLDFQVFGVLNLSHFSTQVVGEPVAVILGRELFDAARFYLDIETGAFRTTEDTSLKNAVRLPLTDAHGIKQVPVRIEGQPEMLADFDLGNGSRVLISEAFARRAGLLDPARITGTESGGGIGGAVTRQLVTLKTIEIGGHTLRNVQAAIDPSPDATDANIGVSVLRRFELLIDFPGGAVWLRPRGG